MGCREVKTEDEEAHFYFYLPTIVVTASPALTKEGGRDEGRAVAVGRGASRRLHRLGGGDGRWTEKKTSRGA